MTSEEVLLEEDNKKEKERMIFQTLGAEGL